MTADKSGCKMIEENKFIETPVNLSKIFYRALHYWYYLPIFLAISLTSAYFIYKSTVPKFQISSKLLISDEQEQTPAIGSTEAALPGINLGSNSNVENQLIILKSSQQIEKTLKQLDFTISYFKKDAFKEVEIYKRSPFYIKLDTSGIQLPDVKYDIEFVSKDEFIISRSKGESLSKKHKFFEQIKIDNLSFSIIPKETTQQIDLTDLTFSFQINPLEQLIVYYQKKIIISDITTDASIFEISLIENNVQKGMDFINKLSENSVAYTLEKKNQIAINTIQFIESQLIDISDSLNMTKNMLENFRSRNEMMDISMQGQMIIDKTEALEVEKNIITRQLDYYKYLENFLESNQNILNLLPPSVQGVENIIVEQLVSELAVMNADKQSLQFNSKEGNPTISRINRQIDGQKQTILQQAKSNIVSTQEDLDDVNRRLIQLSSEIRKLPQKEQVSLDIEQKFQSTDRMHTYLMERRSEAQLAKASNTPDNEIIEPARLIRQTQPNPKQLGILVILIGIFIPFIIIFLAIYTNNKILDKDDLLSMTTHPIIGVIPHLKSNLMIDNDSPHTLLSESVRSIRTSLDFFPIPDNPKCILVTSGLPNEGKSLSAINLAISYAQLGKKTVIIDFDMRRPTIHKLMNIENNGYGLSSFLAHHNLNNTSNLIHSSKIHRMEVITSVEIPPNPAELIAGEHAALLINELKKLYEIIIIDSPPIGLVTDAVLLSRYSDINILVTRHNQTPKPMLTNLLRDPKIQSINNLCLLLNDLPVTQRAYNNYSYSSKYYK